MAEPITEAELDEWERLGTAVRSEGPREGRYYTRADVAFEHLGHEQMLRLIAEVRRLRTRVEVASSAFLETCDARDKFSDALRALLAVVERYGEVGCLARGLTVTEAMQDELAQARAALGESEKEKDDAGDSVPNG